MIPLAGVCTAGSIVRALKNGGVVRNLNFSSVHTQVLGEEADTLRHTLAELGVRIGRDQVGGVFLRADSAASLAVCVRMIVYLFFCVRLFEQKHVRGVIGTARKARSWSRNALNGLYFGP